MSEAKTEAVVLGMEREAGRGAGRAEGRAAERRDVLRELAARIAGAERAKALKPGAPGYRHDLGPLHWEVVIDALSALYHDVAAGGHEARARALDAAPKDGG